MFEIANVNCNIVLTLVKRWYTNASLTLEQYYSNRYKETKQFFRKKQLLSRFHKNLAFFLHNMDNRNKSLSYLQRWDYKSRSHFQLQITVKILKFGTPQTIAIIVLKIEKFDVTSH